MKLKRKLTSLAVLLVMTVAFLAGCGNKDVTLTDREGNEFKAPKKIERIISTAPSNTEVLVGLGLADKLVAVDKYSEGIEGISEDLTKINFRNPDAESIIALNPDIIIASGHNKSGDEDPFKAVKEAGISVAYIPTSTSIDGIYGDIEFIASLTNTKSKGTEMINDMKKEIEAVKKIGDSIEDKKTVYFEIASGSKLSSFGSGTFLNEMIDIIGAKNIFADENGWISPSEEVVVTANPQVILTNQTYLDDPIGTIATRAGWEGVAAVKNNNIYVIDNNTSSRSSQNVIKALKEMAKAVYPDKYE